MREEKEFVKILELDNEFEAGLLSAELEKEEIPHRVKSHFDKAYDGLFQFQYGWGYLSAPARYQDKIEKIYLDLKKGEEFDD